MLQTGEQRKLAVCAVGVCVPGIVRPKTGRVWAPNIPGWDDYPLKAEIKAAVSDQAVKDRDRKRSVGVDSGRSLAGGGADCRNAIFLAVGTGIGAGILVDGRVLHWAARHRRRDRLAVHWIVRFGRNTRAAGALKVHASGEGIADMAARSSRKHRQHYNGPLHNAEPLTAHEVFSAYEAGDEIAKEVCSNAIEFWGMASANLISLFNPEKIIFGGGVFGPATQFLDAIAHEARRWAQPVALSKLSLRRRNWATMPRSTARRTGVASAGAQVGSLKTDSVTDFELLRTQSSMYSKNLVFAAACLGMLLFGIVFLSSGLGQQHAGRAISSG